MTRRSILWWRRTTMDRWCIMKGMPSRSMTRFRPSYLCWIAVLFSDNASNWVRLISWKSNGTMAVFRHQLIPVQHRLVVLFNYLGLSITFLCFWSSFNKNGQWWTFKLYIDLNDVQHIYVMKQSNSWLDDFLLKRAFTDEIVSFHCVWLEKLLWLLQSQKSNQ